MLRSVSNTLLAIVLATTSLVNAQTSAQTNAQTSAPKPIRLICPFPPAGAVDIASRAIATELAKFLGTTVTVENRPGAGGNIGGVEAVRSAPDGNTLFMTTSGINAINPALYAKMPFDPIKELAPVVALVSLSNVLVVHPSVKANSVADIIAMARAEPGKMNYASSGSGTSIHMSGEMFKHLAKVDIVHIPYKGSGPAMTDLLGGQVMMMFDNIPSALPHIKAGKLRALAVTGARRDPLLPDVPTVAEAGVPGYESGVWFGLAVPAATSKEDITRINEAAVKGTKAPEFVKRMTELGYTIIGSTPEQMAEMNKLETARWGPIVKASGAKAD